MYELGLIGFPIKHSLSPWIQNKLLENANLTGNYQLFEFDQQISFEKQINELKQTNINGFNVTVPYKQTIIPYLDEIDKTAKNIGAVNTVLRKNGKWIGYNTDGSGYVRSLKSNFPDLSSEQKKRILLIGSGGAARGIYYALIEEGFEYIDIANRTEASAKEIAKLKKDITITNILSLQEAEATIDNYDVIIQTTSVGMRPEEDAVILSLERINQDTIVSDIVYQPIKTRFLTEAEKFGAKIHFGHEMLLYQALYAFEIWTNKQVSITSMNEELKQILEGE